MIKKLNARQREILTMRFGLDGNTPKTLGEVSQIVGRTQERVRQIQKQSLLKLRKMLKVLL